MTAEINNQRISASPVRRCLRERDIWSHKAYRVNVILTPVRWQNRYNWGMQHLRWTKCQWKGVLFRNEHFFCIGMNDGRAKVWRCHVERYADCWVMGLQIGVAEAWWCGVGISWRYITHLVVIEGNMTASRYIDEVLQPVAFCYSSEMTLTYRCINRITPDLIRQNRE